MTVKNKGGEGGGRENITNFRITLSLIIQTFILKKNSRAKIIIYLLSNALSEDSWCLTEIFLSTGLCNMLEKTTRTPQMRFVRVWSLKEYKLDCCINKSFG